ncbi:MAG: hypothetical protein K2Y35_09250 [Burkholderiales bacterium]|jgi:hypothetical protein|nr:hypothetical protein [Burkholderiales bacterium]
MFGLFDTKKVDDFARSLAQDLARRFPPASEARTDKGAANQLAVVTEGLYARALRFHQENKLGVYRKAKLGNVFRWQLQELGYSANFIENVTKGLVVRLAKKK